MIPDDKRVSKTFRPSAWLPWSCDLNLTTYSPDPLSKQLFENERMFEQFHVNHSNDREDPSTWEQDAVENSFGSIYQERPKELKVMMNGPSHPDDVDPMSRDKHAYLTRRALIAATAILPAAAAFGPAALAQSAGGRLVDLNAGSDKNRPFRLSGNTILITGGGTGIGRGLAEALQRMDNTVIIASRKRAVLEATAAANPGMIAMTVDVRDPEVVRRFAAQVTEAHPRLNVLFNNAGIMRLETIIGQPADLGDSLDHVETNLNGPIRMTAALLTHLQRQRQAMIVNSSSGLAFVPRIDTPTYSATKAAVHSYTVSLRRQLQGSRINVVELAPPAIQTNLMPGMATDPANMPLPQFIAEVISLLGQQPTPKEILVERVKMLRLAEANGTYDQVLNKLNPPHRT